MNTDQAAQLLKTRLDLTEQRYSQDTIATWAEAFNGHDPATIRRAMLALVDEGERNITVAALKTRLNAGRPKPPPPPLGHDGCIECDGTGFSTIHDEHGTARQAPCTRCRPNHPAHRISQTGYPAPIQFAVMRDVQARRDWWRNGRPGHWPGCPCDACTARRAWNGDGT